MVQHLNDILRISNLRHSLKRLLNPIIPDPILLPVIKIVQIVVSTSTETSHPNRPDITEYLIIINLKLPRAEMSELFGTQGRLVAGVGQHFGVASGPLGQNQVVKQ